MSPAHLHDQDPMPAATHAGREPAPARGAVAIIKNSRGELLLHLRDDLPGVVWAGFWSVLGGGCDPGETPAEAIVRELDEEAGLTVGGLTQLFEARDKHGSGQQITFFVGHWDGDARALPLAEGVELRWFAPERLPPRIPPYIRAGIDRYLAAHTA